VGIYVHFPFCLKKCPYCDFISYDDSPLDRWSYINAVVRELECFREISDSAFEARSVYFGGGTPSLMEPRMAQKVIEAVGARFGFSPDVEISLEVNPATSSAGDMRAFRAAGVNRVVIGVQSTDTRTLRILGRSHSPKEASTAFETARKAGFDTVGIDLIFGVPGQTRENWAEDLERALDMAPDHVSAYMLKPPRGWSVPPDDEIGRMYLQAVERLETAGLRQYEVSNFAREGKRCRHNLNYWKSGDYLGLGAAAHSRMDVSLLERPPRKISGKALDPSETSGAVYLRWWNIREPESFINGVNSAGSAVLESDAVDEKSALDEKLMLRLRLSEGMPLAGLSGQAADRAKEMGEELAAAGLARISRGAIRLTPAGMLLADEIAANLAARL